jgi:hypothetical protein
MDVDTKESWQSEPLHQLYFWQKAEISQKLATLQDINSK